METGSLQSRWAGPGLRGGRRALPWADAPRAQPFREILKREKGNLNKSREP